MSARSPWPRSGLLPHVTGHDKLRNESIPAEHVSWSCARRAPSASASSSADHRLSITVGSRFMLGLVSRPLGGHTHGFVLYARYRVSTSREALTFALVALAYSKTTSEAMSIAHIAVALPLGHCAASVRWPPQQAHNHILDHNHARERSQEQDQVTHATGTALPSATRVTAPCCRPRTQNSRKSTQLSTSPVPHQPAKASPRRSDADHTQPRFCRGTRTGLGGHLARWLCTLTGTGSGAGDRCTHRRAKLGGNRDCSKQK